MATLEQKGKDLSKAGYKTIAIAIFEGDARETDAPVFRFVGLLPMIDPPREGKCRVVYQRSRRVVQKVALALTLIINSTLDLTPSF